MLVSLIVHFMASRLLSLFINVSLPDFAFFELPL
jgi:hypothetical protein